ncbi:hypothetical protein A5652_18080 [Mycobacterium sp. 1165178.9]|nr:hypothetical protein A5652_18080 [Mycobacterium sp. 1165178.9]
MTPTPGTHFLLLKKWRVLSHGSEIAWLCAARNPDDAGAAGKATKAAAASQALLASLAGCRCLGAFGGGETGSTPLDRSARR